MKEVKEKRFAFALAYKVLINCPKFVLDVTESYKKRNKSADPSATVNSGLSSSLPSAMSWHPSCRLHPVFV